MAATSNRRNQRSTYGAPAFLHCYLPVTEIIFCLFHPFFIKTKLKKSPNPIKDIVNKVQSGNAILKQTICLYSLGMGLFLSLQNNTRLWILSLYHSEYLSLLEIYLINIFQEKPILLLIKQTVPDNVVNKAEITNFVESSPSATTLAGEFNIQLNRLFSHVLFLYSLGMVWVRSKPWSSILLLIA